MKFIQVQWTAPNLEEARKISENLVLQRLIACANILTEVESIYIWDQKICKDKEVKVLMKTESSKYAAILAYIQKEASYEVSEVSCIHIEKNNPEYEKWILQMLEGGV